MVEVAALYSLVWTRTQAEAALRTAPGQARLLPVTPAAMGAVLEAEAPLEHPTLAYLDMSPDWRGLNDEAMAGARQVLDCLRPDRAKSAAALGSTLIEMEALDLWLLYLWFREFLHLRAVIERLVPRNSGARVIPAPATDGSPSARRAAWVAGCVLADLGQLAAIPALDLPGMEDDRIAIPHPGRDGAGETVLVSAFGQPDIGGLLRYLSFRRRKHPVLMLCEEEFSHHQHLAVQLESYRARFGDIRLAGPGIMPLAGDPGVGADERARAPSVTEAMAEAIRQHYWPRRVRVEQAVNAAFDRHTIREAIVSDHIGDAAMAISAQVRMRGAKLRVLAHSGLPMHPAFRLPLGGVKRGNLIVSTRARGKLEADNFTREGVCLGVKVRKPRAFRISPLEWLNKRLRGILPERAICRVGLFMTSGQFAFAPDRPLSPVIAKLRALVHHCADGGFAFTCRLREHEDDPTVLRHLIGADAHVPLAFERVGESSLTRFLARCDVVIEVGAPTSASLAAIAHEVPVFRLAAFEAWPGWCQMPQCPVMPEGADIRWIRGIAFSAVQRQRHLALQRKLLA